MDNSVGEWKLLWAIGSGNPNRYYIAYIVLNVIQFISWVSSIIKVFSDHSTKFNKLFFSSKISSTGVPKIQNIQQFNPCPADLKKIFTCVLDFFLGPPTNLLTFTKKCYKSVINGSIYIK